MNELYVRSASDASSDLPSSSDTQTLNEDIETIRGTPTWHFESNRVRKEDVRTPWLLEQTGWWDTRAFIIIQAGAWLGVMLGVLLMWEGWTKTENHNYCLVYEDDFSQGLDPDVWKTEVQLGGFGTGSFEMTTADEENVFVDEVGLNIMPTLQDEDLMNTHGAAINLGKECTANNSDYCSARTDTHNGTVVPPVKSARINTSKQKYITYGRVDIVAKLPAGDWLWPAIWMMPMGHSYGPWPASGEIDVVESRGNNHSYPGGGNNIISSSLHWGPDAQHDAWYHTYERRTSGHTTFSAGFNIFTLEWSQKYLFTYINNRLKQVLYAPLTTSSWEKGDFASTVDANGTGLKNPWGNALANAPFDKPFYLILSVAAGATNGYFEDEKGGKPWKDDSPTAAKEFWDARETWHPTWTQPAMQVKKVVMWQQCNGDEQDWWISNNMINADYGLEETSQATSRY